MEIPDAAQRCGAWLVLCFVAYHDLLRSFDIELLPLSASLTRCERELDLSMRLVVLVNYSYACTV